MSAFSCRKGCVTDKYVENNESHFTPNVDYIGITDKVLYFDGRSKFMVSD